jgi:hypothetical protein
MVVEEGELKGVFHGFRRQGTIFEFRGGARWKQAEHKYQYHYAYMPEAKVIEKDGVYLLEVEDMDDSVEVVEV